MIPPFLPAAPRRPSLTDLKAYERAERRRSRRSHLTAIFYISPPPPSLHHLLIRVRRLKAFLSKSGSIRSERAGRLHSMCGGMESILHIFEQFKVSRFTPPPPPPPQTVSTHSLALSYRAHHLVTHVQPPPPLNNDPNANVLNGCSVSGESCQRSAGRPADPICQNELTLRRCEAEINVHFRIASTYPYGIWLTTLTSIGLKDSTHLVLPT